MSWQAWTTLGVILAMVLTLARGRFGPDVVIVGAVALLVFLGVLTPAQALSGMSNEGVATIAVLYVVVCGLTETGAVRWIGSIMLGRPKSQRGALIRLITPVTALSGFVNNTPLVAMMIPAINDFCRQRQWPASKFMLPLSYAAILGGTCTLIGPGVAPVVCGLTGSAARISRARRRRAGTVGGRSDGGSVWRSRGGRRNRWRRRLRRR